jgi:hypothetical protein
MARYIVLSFDKNEDADEFVKAHQDNNIFTWPEGSMGGVSNDHEVLDAGGLIALIAKPTQFHGPECPGSGRRVKGWARGTTFGWWVCEACKKPAPGTGTDHRELEESLMRQVVSQGVNLLEGAANEFASVFHKGWGALGRGANY